MPQTTTIETITIVRPLKVIAFICGVFVILLMIMGLVSTDWLMAEGWRQGLFAHCIKEDATTPLPFNIVDPPGCYQARDVGYIKAAAILCVMCLIADIAATILTGLGLRTQDHCNKNKFYRFAVFCMGAALVFLLIALVIYPVCFTAELNFGNRTMWEFGWAYGVGWGAAIFLFGGAVLLLCDKESEEIYYKERKIVRDDVASAGLSHHQHHQPHHVGNNSSSSSAAVAASGNSMLNSSVHYQHHPQQQQQLHHQQPSAAAAHHHLQHQHGAVRSGTQLA